MKGIENINQLIKEMKPVLDNKEYFFCTILKGVPKELDPILIFKEKEGVTLILDRKSADLHSLPYSGIWSLITLSVHSDISAVGFLAFITEKLAKAGISVNVVSAYYHDHLFVPFEVKEKAMKILEGLSVSI